MTSFNTYRIWENVQLCKIMFPTKVSKICPEFGHQAQPVKMDLIKKFLPKQKTIQSFKVDPQGFRKTINENPPMQEFFKIHQRALSTVKNASNQ